MVDVQLTVDPGKPAIPSHFFAAGQQLLHLLDELTDVESSANDWTISKLEVGSAVVAITSDAEERTEAALRVVDGLARARANRSLPASWSPGATGAAQGLVRSLGTSIGNLKVLDNVVFLDSQLGERLEALTPWVREMPGALRGTLTGFNINRGNRASLKLKSGRVVRCSFPSTEAERMRDALMQFVELEGTIRQDEDGQPYWISTESVEVVPPAPMKWTELIGFNPHATDGRPVSEYLAVIRGEA